MPPEPDAHAAGEFALIADAAPVPMWVTRADGSRAFVNQAYCRFAGLPYHRALLLDWRKGLHPDDHDAALAATEAGLAGGGAFAVEARYRRADGQWRWLRSVSQPRRAGEPGGYIGVAHDITEAKGAEAEIRARERQLSALIDQTNAGLAQIDLDGRFTLVNDRFCAIVGRSREALMRLSNRDITHPDDLGTTAGQFATVLADGRPLSADKRYLRPDGSVVWVSNSVAMRRDEAGAPLGLIAVTQDITVRRAAEEAVRDHAARLQFLDALATATATATDADTVLSVTTRLLGEHLAASGCAYADVDADEDRFHIRGGWAMPGAPSAVGDHRLAHFGEEARNVLRAGQPLVIADTAGEGGAAAYRAMGIAALLCVPFLRGGRLAATVAVHADRARRWTDAELALVREVAERSWAHVERVRAEAALRDSERQLRLAIDGAKIGTWQRDLVTGRGHWSPRTAAIMGVPHDAPLSREAQRALIHPDDRERIAAQTARLVDSGGDFEIEHRVLRPDGAVRWVASHGTVLRDGAGMPVRAIGTVRDVTERRAAQEALTRLNQTLEHEVAARTAERDRMWRLSRDLFVVVDRRRRVRAVNPAVAGLGYAPEEVVGRTLASFIHPDDRAAAMAAIRRATYQPIGEFQARLRGAAGDWFRFSWSAAPGDGEAYVIGRDVTAELARREELDSAQEALRQAQKVESLGQLTGGVAHDFNNLLTPIIGSLDLLGRRAGGDERQARLIGAALESAERARTLVQRLLAFARRQPLQPGPVALAALVASLRTLVESTVGPQVTVVSDIADGLPAAHADANQLELAILNLAVNARDAMPDGGRLDLSAGLADPACLVASGLSGRFLSLCVADTGIGMDADTATRAVEPFFSTKGVGKGTGLGLSMVHGLASQLGGAMRIVTAPGQGTRVELLLPVSDLPVRVTGDTPMTSPVRAGRVLLVDDEPPVRDATAAMLRLLGLEVALAGSGDEALAMLERPGEGAPDYLVTDHLMPGLRGADLARQARARVPALKVLVISGFAALDEIPPDLPRLAKPFRVDELAASLGALA